MLVSLLLADMDYLLIIADCRRVTLLIEVITSLSLQELLQFVDFSGKGADQLVAVLGNHDIVFQTHASDLFVLLDLLLVQVGAQVFVRKGLFDHEVDEVNSRFNRYADAFLESPAGSQFAEAGLVAAGWSFGVASDIVGLQAEEMSKSMGEEDCSNSLGD